MCPHDLDGLPPEDLKKLQEMYLSKLPEKLEAIRLAIEAVRKQQSMETIKALQFLIHKMAGNAGTFGYAEVSRLCKEWDLKLAQESKQSQPQVSLEELDRFFLALKKQFNNS